MTKEKKKRRATSLEERISPRTGHSEYRKKFHWKTKDGKDHSSRTKWHPTPEAAQAAATAEIFARDETGALSEKSFLDSIRDYNRWLRGDENFDMSPGSSRTLQGVGAVLEKTLPERLAKIRAFDIGPATIKDTLGFYMNIYKPERTGHLLKDNAFQNYKKFFSHYLQWLAQTAWGAHGEAHIAATKAAVRDAKRDGATKRRRDKLKNPIPESDFLTYEDFMRCMRYSPYQPLPIEGAGEKALELHVSEPDAWIDADDEIPGGELDYAYTLDNPEVLLEKSGKIRPDVIYTTALYTLFFTGLRFEELRALRWRCVSFSDSTLTVDDAKNYRIPRERRDAYEREFGTVKTASSRRIVTIHKSLWYVLMIFYRASEYYYGGNLQNSLIFRSRATDGMLTPEPLRRFFDRLQARASVHHITIHQLRHSTAHYLCYEMGMSKEDAVLFLGHRDTEMLDSVYARATLYEKKSRLTDATRDYIQHTDAVQAYLAMDAQHRREADIKGFSAYESAKKQAERHKNFLRIQNVYDKILSLSPDVYLPPLERASALSDAAIAEIADQAEAGLGFLNVILQKSTSAEARQNLIQNLTSIFTY